MVLLLLFSQVETLWSFDWGFFKANYQVNAVLRDSTDNLYIYTEESEYPIKKLYVLGGVLYALTENGIYSYSYDAATGTGKWSIITGDDEEESFIFQAQDLYAKQVSSSKPVIVGTSSGAYFSLNGGLRWSDGNEYLESKNIKAVTIVPDTVPLSRYYYFFAVSQDGYVYQSNKTPPFRGWTLITRKIYETDLEAETYGTVPGGWSENQVEDEALFDIRVDSLNGEQALLLFGSHTNDATSEAVSITYSFDPVPGIMWKFSFFAEDAGYYFTQDTIYDTVIVQDGDTFYFDTLFVNQQEHYNSGPEFVVYDADGNPVAEIGVISGKISYYSVDEGWKSMYTIDKGETYPLKIEIYNGKGKVYIENTLLGEFDLLSAGDVAGIAYRVNTNSYTTWVDSIQVYALPSVPGEIYDVVEVAGKVDILVSSSEGIYTWKDENDGFVKVSDAVMISMKWSRTDTTLFGIGEDGVYVASGDYTTWTKILERNDVLTVEALNKDTIWVGLNGGGILRTLDGGTNWVEINTGFADWGCVEYTGVVYDIYAFDVDSVYAGTGEGPYFFNGEKWVEEGKGLYAWFITPSMIDLVKYVLEEYTPPETDCGGLLDFVATYFGDLPDYDRNPRIKILMQDIKDGYNWAHPYHIYAYFDPVNEYPQLVADSIWGDSVYMSNFCEMLYVDVGELDYTDTSALVSALTEPLVRMVMFNYDPEELGSRKGFSDGGTHSPFVEGIAALAEFLAVHGISHDTVVIIDSSNYSLPSSNSFTFWGDQSYGDGSPNTESEKTFAYLFAMYIYDKFGLDGIKNIVQDTLTGIEGVENALGASFEDLYSGFILSCVTHEIDVLPNVSVTMPLVSPGRADNYPYSGELAEWSVGALRFQHGDLYTPPNQNSPIRFNGDDTGGFMVYCVYIDSLGNVLEIDTIALNEYNEGVMEISQFFEYPDTFHILGFLVISKAYEGELEWVIDDDLESATYLRTILFQNPCATEKLELYIYSSERLYRNLVETPDVEVKYLVDETTTVTEDLTCDILTEPENDSIIKVIYRTSYIFSEPGSYTIVVKGEDLAGNDITPDSTELEVIFMIASEETTVAAKSGNVKVHVPKGAFPENVWMVVAENKHGIYIGPQVPLTKPVEIFFRAPEGYSVYRMESGVLVEVPGIRVSDGIKVTTDRLGTFVLKEGRVEKRAVFGIVSINPSITSRSPVVLYGVPRDMEVRMDLINVAGRVVRRLVDGKVRAGYHSVRIDTDKLAPGLYFVRMAGDGNESVKKMILVK